MDNEIITNNNNLKKNIYINYINLYKYILFILLLFFIIIIFIITNYLSLYKNLNKWKDISNITLNNINNKLTNQNNVLLKLKKKDYDNFNDKDNDIYKKLYLLKLMTNNNILKYKGMEKCLLKNPDDEYCIYHLISPKQVIGKKRILIGDKRDGCYVLLDDFTNIKIAYSFGISNKIQFDKNLADRSIDVYMYDHIINSLPYNNSRFHWKKIGIAGKNQKNPLLKNLEELILENGHSLEKNMILKIDVEHWEWNSLENISENILKQFKYIVIEFHFYEPKKEAKLYYNVLNILHKHHQVFYLRCHKRYNIATFGNNRICRCLEASYIIKEEYEFIKDESIYPIFEFDFDTPKLYEKEEFNLNILKLFDF